MLIGMWSDDDSVSSLELRTIADWQVRRRLLAIPGIAQVVVMGGERKQYQVRVDPHLMQRYGVSLQEVEQALAESNLNVTGGYLDDGGGEVLVRGLRRLISLEDPGSVVVQRSGIRPILLNHVATVREDAQVKRGDSSVNGRDAVVLTIQKQPGADTRELTEEIVAAIKAMRPALPAGVIVDPSLYQQREFIDFGITNIVEALRDGAILVVIVLFLFLLNLRTTFITLTAIPLSVLTTAIVFRIFGLSFNVMTLGGIAVALGDLVDDPIVDVENIFRRLRENRIAKQPKSALRVVFEASREVRGAIFTSMLLVILVFAPLFALSGMEGRLFAPLGAAYITSILASTAVSLTVTPVLSYYLLPRAKATGSTREGIVLRVLSRLPSPSFTGA